MCVGVGGLVFIIDTAGFTITFRVLQRSPFSFKI